MTSKKSKGVIELIAVVILFLLLTFLVQTNLEFFKGFLGDGIFGMVIFVVLVILSIVIAPIAAIPFIPLVSNIYGWVLTGTLTVIGWTIGSVIAFLIARVYGVKIVEKLVSLESVYGVEDKIPKKNVFWGIVLLRMFVPVDFLSYAIGLFSKIELVPYTLATVIGVIPISFLLAYLGGINAWYQFIVFFVVGVILVIGYIWWLLKRKGKN